MVLIFCWCNVSRRDSNLQWKWVKYRGYTPHHIWCGERKINRVYVVEKCVSVKHKFTRSFFDYIKLNKKKKKLQITSFKMLKNQYIYLCFYSCNDFHNTFIFKLLWNKRVYLCYYIIIGNHYIIWILREST